MSVDRDLLKTILSFEDIDELDKFCQEIFTPAELADLSLRWKLLIDLYRGETQRKIAAKYGISTCKITRGSKLLKSQDSLVLEILKSRT